MAAGAARVVTAKAQQRQTALEKLRNRRPAEIPVWLSCDEALDDAWQDARVARLRTDENDEIAVKAADKAVEQAKTAYEESSIRWVVRCRGMNLYEELLRRHPPRDKDHTDYQANTGESAGRARWNPDTFPAALVSFASVDPEISTEEITEMLGDGRLSKGDLGELFQAALTVHESSRVADLSK